MAVKQELILNYIESLNAGDRFSVRSLARTLSVSEGTAYKAIKCAEARGLLKIKAKGCVRIGRLNTDCTESMTLSSIIKQLGLTVLAGEAFTDMPVRGIMLGDGDVGQFTQNLRSAGDKPLCLVGNRPEIIQEAVALGASVIVTSDSPVDHALIAAANENRVCILSSAQNSYTLLSRMQGCLPASGPEGAGASAMDWMSTPLYLYYNDIAADLHRIYRPVFDLFSKCAVVDDELKICGSVDAVRALSATPSQKISKLYLSDGECYVVDESISMETLAARMISEGTATAFVTRNERLCGIITANDVLRYYRFKAAEKRGPADYTCAVETLDRNGESGTSVYMVKIPKQAAESVDSFPDYLFSLLLSAGRRQIEEMFQSKCDFESGTFYSMDKRCVSGELMISSEVIKKTPSGCTLEVEICDELSCYARCILVASVSGGDE